MSGLSDYIDRLTHSTQSIQSTSISCASFQSGPFTRAILTAELGDLIRDVEPSELGLLTITAPSSAVAHDKETRNQAGVEITRAEFHGATPLRRPAAANKAKDVQPEVYAIAALECMERYQQIRPMPRAYQQVTTILEQLEASNNRIRSVTEQLQQIQSTAVSRPSRDQKSVADEEQERIDELEDRIATLRKHKESLLQQKPSLKHADALPKASRSKAPEPTIDSEEAQFWNSTPGPEGASSKPLRFTDNTTMLLDEEAEFGDMSMASSISSPVPPSSQPITFSPSSPTPKKRSVVDRDPELLFGSNGARDEQQDAEGETVDVPPHDEEPVPYPELKPEPESEDLGETLETPRKDKSKDRRVRVNMEVERAVAKIWSTVGDLIMPGNQFNTTNNLPPVAKATISHLESLSNLTPTVSSPTHSISSTAKSGSTVPTAQQILTAHLLLALLCSDTLSLPMSAVKELLATKASTSGSAAMVSARPKELYACVAKRLLKIERGSGEQVIKFDI